MGIESGLNRREFLQAITIGAAVLGASRICAEGQDDKYKVETIMRNGPNEKRHDLLFLPEGYTKDMQKQFDGDVNEIIRAFDSNELFKEYKLLFNVHKIWLSSEKKWTQDADGKTTAFGIKYDKSRNVPVDDHSIKLRTELQKLAKCDLPCILLPDKNTNGGGGSSVVLIAPNHELFLHEVGHAFGLADEYYPNSIVGINTSRDEHNLPWQPLLERKIRNIKTSRVECEKEYYRGEEGDCIMYSYGEGINYGPICASGIIFRLRSITGCIETSPAADADISKGIEVKVLPSKSYTPKVQAWYIEGDADKLTADFAKKVKPEDMAKHVALEVAVNKATSMVKTQKATKPGVILVRAYDTNPAIILDPNMESVEQKIYRVK